LLLQAGNQCGFITDEVFSGAEDSDDPKAAVANLTLLAKSLEPLGINISPSDIANIASEVRCQTIVSLSPCI
jgi:hypothetical protein